MTKEEITKAVDNLKKIRKQFNKYEFTHSIDLAIDALEEQERPTGEWIPVSEELPDKNGFYLVTVSGYGKHPHMKILGYDAIGKKWGEGGVVAWCNISPYEQEAENETGD